MTPIKRNILYLIRPNGLLRLRVVWNKIRWEVSTGLFIDKTDSKGKPKWDGRRCRNATVHGADKIQAAIINRSISEIEDKIEETFYSFEIADTMPTLEEFKDRYTGKPHMTDTDLFAAFDEFLKEGKEIEQWADNTYKKFRTIKKLLKKFRPYLKFSNINAALLKDLMAFQTKNAVHDMSQKEIEAGKSLIKYKGSYQNETINRNMRLVKWFLKWAHEKKYIDNMDFKMVKTSYKTNKKPIVFLEWDELMKVMELDLSLRPEIEKTRDMFCLCCFTSLRYSDLINLKWGNVSEDSITITTIKTSDAIVIDLNDYSKRILDKYRTPDVKPTDNVFENKSSQKMNMRLKEIAKLCGIDSPVTIVQMTGSKRKDITVPKYELISTHCGRRTFISNAISMGIPPNVVMKWTGHSDYKAMAPYIEIADAVRKQSMDLFNRMGPGKVNDITDNACPSSLQ